jgi:hypothetical protein
MGPCSGCRRRALPLSADFLAHTRGLEGRGEPVCEHTADVESRLTGSGSRQMARPGPAHRPHRLPQPSAPAHTAQPPDSESFHRPRTAPEPTTRPVGPLTGADAAAGPKPDGHGYAEPGPGRAHAARCSRRGGDSARLRAGGAPRAGAVGGRKPPCCGRWPGRAHRGGRRLREVRGPDPDS